MEPLKAHPEPPHTVERELIEDRSPIEDIKDAEERIGRDGSKQPTPHVQDPHSAVLFEIPFGLEGNAKYIKPFNGPQSSSERRQLLQQSLGKTTEAALAFAQKKSHSKQANFRTSNRNF